VRLFRDRMDCELGAGGNDVFAAAARCLAHWSRLRLDARRATWDVFLCRELYVRLPRQGTTVRRDGAGPAGRMRVRPQSIRRNGAALGNTVVRVAGIRVPRTSTASPLRRSARPFVRHLHLCVSRAADCVASGDQCWRRVVGRLRGERDPGHSSRRAIMALHRATCIELEASSPAARSRRGDGNHTNARGNLTPATRAFVYGKRARTPYEADDAMKL